MSQVTLLLYPHAGPQVYLEGRRRPIPHRNPRHPGPVFPLHPLFNAIGQEYLPGMGIGVEGPILRLALRLGVDRQQVYRWMHRWLDQWQADAAAVALGVHPSNVWLNWFTTASEVAA
jgi:hypothetical protein